MRGFFLRYDRAMSDCIEFFEDYIECCHCGDKAIGYVYANTAQVICEMCSHPILDLSENDGGMLVMLELDPDPIEN